MNKNKRRRRRKGQLSTKKLLRWRNDAITWQNEATTNLIHENGLLLNDNFSTSNNYQQQYLSSSNANPIVPSTTNNGDNFENELLALSDLLRPKKLTHAQKRERSLQIVRKKMERAKLACSAKPLTKLEPSFLGLKRAESTRTIPPTLKRWLKHQKNLAPILRSTVSDKANEFPTGGLIKISKKKKTMTGNLLGPEEGVPNWQRHDWGGGMSAGEFALPKATKDTKSHIPNLSMEMEARLQNMIQSNLGLGK